jgi:hypothetical protein
MKDNYSDNSKKYAVSALADALTPTLSRLREREYFGFADSAIALA